MTSSPTRPTSSQGSSRGRYEAKWSRGIPALARSTGIFWRFNELAVTAIFRPVLVPVAVSMLSTRFEFENECTSQSCVKRFDVFSILVTFLNVLILKVFGRFFVFTSWIWLKYFYHVLTFFNFPAFFSSGYGNSRAMLVHTLLPAIRQR